MFKKAKELSTLYGVETAVIILSEQRKLFSCSQPDVDQVLDRYLAETERVSNNFPSLIKNNIENQLANKKEHVESLKRLEKEQAVAKMIGSMNNFNGGGFWWDLPIDNMENLIPCIKSSWQAPTMHGVMLFLSTICPQYSR
ncbi:BOX PROTEIN putative-RELATED [Salix koriyanagi]|uniref:BOX PROTEIN putative-RELATED n=1 Tax=Salix koriyanagi TaxID=2511006 RepID=A0A9Q0X3B0_9ROSI|nr:BOX PROTEIN putative-RELATED [Salix koriyanagi]